MRRVARWVLLIAAVALPAGCASWKRPYAQDPLLRDGRGVWGDITSERKPLTFSEPEAPRAPTPTELPSGEWERPE